MMFLLPWKRKRRDPHPTATPSVGINPPSRYVLGGRAFLATREITVQQHFTLQALAEHANLAGEVKREDETLEEYAVRIRSLFNRSNAQLLMLGIFLVPEEYCTPGEDPGQAWSERVAVETADYLGKLTIERDRMQIYTLVTYFLNGFFRSGVASSGTLPSSSDRATPGERSSASASSLRPS